jgi:hypothetical protein
MGPPAEIIMWEYSKLKLAHIEAIVTEQEKFCGECKSRG